MKCINRIFYLLILALSFYGCNAQVPANINKYMQGRWKIVFHDYHGYQKFSRVQAEKIEKADLIIKENSYYYERVKFIDTCHFEKWKKIQLDSLKYADFHGLSLPNRYSINELNKFLELMPIQKNGTPSCYNECNLFFIKQDTLINICGGYTYYLIKSSSTKK